MSRKSAFARLDESFKASPEEQALFRAWQLFLLLGVVTGLLCGALTFRASSEAERAVWLGLSWTRLAIAGGMLVVLLALVGLWLETWLRRERAAARLRGQIARLIRPGRRPWELVVSGAVFLLSLQAVLLTFQPGELPARPYLERLLPATAWLAALSGQTLAALGTWRSRSRQRAIAAGQLAQSPEGTDGQLPRIFWIMLALYGLVFLAWGWVRSAWAPQESLRVGWNSQGVPILETQLLLAWAAGLILLWLGGVQSKRWKRPVWAKPWMVDLGIALGLWLAAVWLWQATPMLQNWFISEARSPNYEIYPNSDAQRYDASAQNALDGLGFRFFEGPYIRRPALAAVFTLLHVFRGQEYDQVISLQVLILAALPALVYLLGGQLFNRAAGIIAAILIILREGNSIAAADRITSSNARLLMADLPAALMVMAFSLAALTWLRADANNPGRAHSRLGPLVAGGLLGLCMLIRLETAVFILALALVRLVSPGANVQPGMRKDTRLRQRWTQVALFLAGIGLVISPWVYRNWQVTGQIFVDSPNFGLTLLAQRFRPVATETPLATREAPAASPEATLERPGPTAEPGMQVTPEAQQAPAPPGEPAPTAAGPVGAPPTEPTMQEATQQALEFIRSNPLALLRSFVAHTLNSQVQAFLTFPTTFRLIDSTLLYLGHRSPERLWVECCSLESYIRRLPYWRKWNGAFPLESLLPLALMVICSAAGIAAAWQTQRWKGLLLLLMFAVYILFNGALRNSGGRYLLPIDWILVLYFSVGLAYFTGRLSFRAADGETQGWFERASGGPGAEPAAAGSEAPALAPVVEPSRGRWSLAGVALVLLLVGLAIPGIERLFPERYFPERRQEMLQALLTSPRLEAEQRQQLEGFLEQGGVLLAGRALYPRYFAAGLDEVGSHRMFGPPEVARLAFYLSGPVSGVVWLPLQNKVNYFPNSSDVLVFVCSVIPYTTLSPVDLQEKVISSIPGTVNATTQVFAVSLFDASGEPQLLLFRSPLPVSTPGEAVFCPLLEPFIGP